MMMVRNRKNSVLTTFTKEALVDSFVALVSERPMDKIKIQDIVDHCGVNRNTFYYHFADIYSLLEYLFEDEAKKTINYIDSGASFKECFRHSISFIIQHRIAVIHIANSINRELLENYFCQSFYHMLKEYLTQNFQVDKINPEDFEFLISFYEHAFVGMTMDWITNGINELPDEETENFLRKLDNLFNSMIPLSLERKLNKFDALSNL